MSSFAAYGQRVSLHTLRHVWAALTANPQAPIRELVAETHTCRASVAAAIEILRQAGYVEFAPRTNRARRVVVPFVEVAR